MKTALDKSVGKGFINLETLTSELKSHRQDNLSGIYSKLHFL